MYPEVKQELDTQFKQSVIELAKFPDSLVAYIEDTIYLDHLIATEKTIRRAWKSGTF